MRSAVPLPCFFNGVESPEIAGQQPQQETKFCRIGNEPKIYQKFPEESWLATNDASIMCSNGGVGCGVGGGGIGGDMGGGVGSDNVLVMI